MPAENTTDAFTLCPAFKVSGVVNPVLKPVPVKLSPLSVMEADPVLVIFTVCVLEVFKTRLPNATLAGVAVSFAAPGAGVGVGEPVGVGVGPGPAADCDPFAHPASIANVSASDETRSR